MKKQLLIKKYCVYCKRLMKQRAKNPYCSKMKCYLRGIKEQPKKSIIIRRSLEDG